MGEERGRLSPLCEGRGEGGRERGKRSLLLPPLSPPCLAVFGEERREGESWPEREKKSLVVSSLFPLLFWF
jgi:hypothetical protein